jgi:hypothetical protein
MTATKSAGSHGHRKQQSPGAKPAGSTKTMAPRPLGVASTALSLCIGKPYKFR